MQDAYRTIAESLEFRKLNSSSEFQVILDFAGKFYRASIGDSAQGFRLQRRTRTLSAAIEWLREQARTSYPESRYVQELSWPENVVRFKAPTERRTRPFLAPHSTDHAHRRTG